MNADGVCDRPNSVSSPEACRALRAGAIAAPRRKQERIHVRAMAVELLEERDQ